MENKGVTIRHIFAPNMAIVNSYELPDALIKNNERYTTFDEKTLSDKNIFTDNKVKDVYLHLTKQIDEAKNPEDLQFLNCIKYEEISNLPYQKKDNLSSRYSSLPLQDKTSAGNRFTGQYMIGYIAVGIYLMESNGSQENWWPEAEQTTFNEIVEGLDWLAEQASQRGVKVVWVYPPVEKIDTNDEPINDRSVPYYSWETVNWVFNWLDDIYTSHGLPDEWDGAYALANKLRKDYKTNWAVEIAVVMDEYDFGHDFNDGMYAYVKDYEIKNYPFGSPEFRAPIVVFTYNNNFATPAGMDYFASHEVSHVFGASDEYTRTENPPSTCKDNNSCGHQRAFLSYDPAVNGNCETCNNNQTRCIMSRDGRFICSFTPAELGWRDSYDNDGAVDPIDQNTNAYMWIQPVAAGDLIRVVTLGGELIYLVSVTNDMLCGSSNNAIFWDGSMNNDLWAPYGIYAVSKNGSNLGTFNLNYSSASSGNISNHYFNLDTLSFTNNNSTVYIRHEIYDSLNNLYSRPRFDVMTNSSTIIKTNILGYKDGIYTSKVFGWRSDGVTTNNSTLTFINYICADVENNGIVGISDLNFMVDYLFQGGPSPDHYSAGDIWSHDQFINIMDLTSFVNWMFEGGYEPDCMHSL